MINADAVVKARLQRRRVWMLDIVAGRPSAEPVDSCGIATIGIVEPASAVHELDLRLAYGLLVNVMLSDDRVAPVLFRVVEFKPRIVHAFLKDVTVQWTPQLGMQEYARV